MRAIAVRPGIPGSVHAREVDRPSVDDVPGGRGVLVQTIRVGLCGTDQEIIDGRFGTPPAGDDFLVLGHESLGRVAAVGDAVHGELEPGTLVVATVRHAGASPYDRLGMYDFTTDPPLERGINRWHGFLSEYYLDTPEFLVPVPAGLAQVGVLLEPLSIVEKGLAQADEIQRRLRIWRPRRAAVTGAGTIGLLVTLSLRLRGVDVTVLSRRAPPYRNSDLVEALGATYLSTTDTTLAAASLAHGPFDLVFEASGHSPFAFEAVGALQANGIVVLSSVTGGAGRIEIDANAINQDLVLNNKVMIGTVNASRDDFIRGVDDMVQAETAYPGWLERLLTTPVHGLSDARAIVTALGDREAIKAYIVVDRASEGAR